MRFEERIEKGSPNWLWGVGPSEALVQPYPHTHMVCNVLSYLDQSLSCQGRYIPPLFSCAMSTLEMSFIKACLTSCSTLRFPTNSAEAIHCVAISCMLAYLVFRKLSGVRAGPLPSLSIGRQYLDLRLSSNYYCRASKDCNMLGTSAPFAACSNMGSRLLGLGKEKGILYGSALDRGYHLAHHRLVLIMFSLFGLGLFV